MSKITDKPRTLSELANIYGVSAPTMKKWLQCDELKHLFKEKKGNYFQIPALREIVKHLDEPVSDFL